MKFRPHRGGLSESIAEEREIPETKEALSLEAGLALGRYISPSEITITCYGFDQRMKWDTYLVSVKDVGPIGYTNKATKE